LGLNVYRHRQAGCGTANLVAEVILDPLACQLTHDGREQEQYHQGERG